jgi:ADP-ribosyl-[dinitrogen reductase] hydrolase
MPMTNPDASQIHDTLTDRFRGALIGLAVGDALGTTVEFRPRGSFEQVTDMLGGGPFQLQPGQWTDDTSMALCLAASLAECGGFNPGDQMTRYVRWYREGYMSATGTCFDIGNATRDALSRFERRGDPFAGSTDPYAAGNGCLMRLAPVPMAFFGDIDQAGDYSAESARTTHGALECVEASCLFGRMLHRALAGGDKAMILSDDAELPFTAPAIAALAKGAYTDKTREAISGSGYVVHSLEAALWCFQRTESFAEAVLMAVNLGDDADTTAAICGQLAGAFYGASGIPAAWRERVSHYALLQDMADALLPA